MEGSNMEISLTNYFFLVCHVFLEKKDLNLYYFRGKKIAQGIFILAPSTKAGVLTWLLP